MQLALRRQAGYVPSFLIMDLMKPSPPSLALLPGAQSSLTCCPWRPRFPFVFLALPCVVPVPKLLHRVHRRHGFRFARSRAHSRQSLLLS